jgi:hypothetical protein
MRKKQRVPKLWLRGYRFRNPRLWLFYRTKQYAKLNGQRHNIVLEDLPEIPEYCPVFPWIKLKVRRSVGSGARNPSAPSADRIDSSKGYVKGNIRIISWRANELKNNGTLREFLALAKDARKPRAN